MSSTIRITTINNAIFGPIDANDWLANLSNIESRDLCICQCYTKSHCVTVNYYGRQQKCILFSAPLQLEQLHVMTTSEDTTVISFQNTNYVDVVTTATTTTTVATTTTTTTATTITTVTTITTTTTTITTITVTTTITVATAATTAGTTTATTATTATTTGTTVTTTYNTTLIVTTVANYSCTPSTTSIFNYTTTPTSYESQTYNYTALSTGTATLEFGFMAKNSDKIWYLDDVSVVDTTAANLEKLVNGDFENGSLIGWQVLCSTVNCGGTGGILVQSSCHTGSYCYEGTCQEKYDFLRQSFSVSSGHHYLISFWLQSGGHSQQAAYFNIYEQVVSG